MKKTLFFSVLIFFLLKVNVHAQFDSLMVQTDSIKLTSGSDIFTLGFGFGLDHGGIGMNAIVYPQHNIGIFGGFGYNLYNVGVNAGIKIRISSEKKFRQVTPYLTAMYGYNAVVLVKNMSELNDSFNGVTLGAGVDFKAWPKAKGYWTMGLLVPIRTSEAYDYIDELEDKGIVFGHKYFPVTLSIGYKLILSSRNR